MQIGLPPSAVSEFSIARPDGGRLLSDDATVESEGLRSEDVLVMDDVQPGEAVTFVDGRSGNSSRAEQRTEQAPSQQCKCALL